MEQYPKLPPREFPALHSAPTSHNLEEERKTQRQHFPTAGGRLPCFPINDFFTDAEPVRSRWSSSTSDYSNSDSDSLSDKSIDQDKEAYQHRNRQGQPKKYDLDVDESSFPKPLFYEHTKIPNYESSKKCNDDINEPLLPKPLLYGKPRKLNHEIKKKPEEGFEEYLERNNEKILEGKRKSSRMEPLGAYLDTGECSEADLQDQLFESLFEELGVKNSQVNIRSEAEVNDFWQNVRGHLAIDDDSLETEFQDDTSKGRMGAGLGERECGRLYPALPC